jgi:hypothetical protein
LRLIAKNRASLYLVKLRKITVTDTQAIRAKLLRQLDGLFQMAISIAKSKVKRLKDEEDNECCITLSRGRTGRVTDRSLKTNSSIAIISIIFVRASCLRGHSSLF